MKVSALFFLMVAVAFGSDRRDVAAVESGADFLAIAATADRVEIDTPQPSSVPVKVTLSKKREMREFLGRFVFSAVPLRGQKIFVDGEEAWIVAPCQCLGDYRFRFLREGAEVVSVTFHHQQFIRVEGESQGAEFDLVPESGTGIRKQVVALTKKNG